MNPRDPFRFTAHTGDETGPRSDVKPQLQTLEWELAARDAELEAARCLERELAAERQANIHLRAIIGQRWDERIRIMRSRSWRLLEPFREWVSRKRFGRASVSLRLAIADMWGAMVSRPALRSWPPTDPFLEGVPEAGTAARFSTSPETVRSPSFIEFRTYPDFEAPVDLLAFYLPQFYPIPENDRWWGEGFTEWQNVVRGRPRFSGHDQPKLPGPLGFYDLRVPDTLRRQASLARNYGIAGFVFHLYWFGGKRLLERPLDIFASDPEITLPFCVCWANENWTRRWDGRDSEVLIAQEHSPEDDVRFIAEVARYLRNPRYWRIDGKPLLIVYWAAGLPDARATGKRWRRWCQEHGIGEIHLATVESLEATDPKAIGFDSSIEFPPNLMGPPKATGVSPEDPSFAGEIYDYGGLARASALPRPAPFPRFRGICPSWDNEARKPNRGTMLAGASPERYQRWLEALVAHEIGNRPRSRRLLFVNAWNEWAEGACLEPDLRLGYAYLEATRRALSASATAPSGRVAVVIHDALRHGAQLNGTAIAAELAPLGHRPVIVLLGEGNLRSAMAGTADLEDWSGLLGDPHALREAAAALRALGVDAALVNTVLSARVLESLEDAGIRCVSLVHELPRLIDRMGLEAEVRAIARSRCPVVFAHEAVRDGFPADPATLAGRTFVLPQGIYLRSRFLDRRTEAREFLERHHALPRHVPLVVNAGFGDWRKAPDLFAAMAPTVASRVPDARFAWIGEMEPDRLRDLRTDFRSVGLESRLVLPGFTEDVDAFLAGAGALALTSREDPYPSVALEAMQHGVPVVAFEGTGGIASLVEREFGDAVARWDVEAFGRRVADRIIAPPSVAMASLSERIRHDHSMRDYASALVRIARRRPEIVSVVVPNYNYGRYLEARFDSIIAQGEAIGEIIFLDDGSSDGSIERVEAWRRRTGATVRSILNPSSSGNVTAQWLRGVRQAVGDFVWIAEADDLCLPGMIDRLLTCMQDPAVVMAHCDSRVIDEDGREVKLQGRDQLRDLDPARWERDWTSDGRRELSRYLAVKNTIPNVSAVLFRRQPLLDGLLDAFPIAIGLRGCGDWLTYCHILLRGSLSYVAEPLNRQRRHRGSVIAKMSRFEIARESGLVQERVRTLVDVEPKSRARADLHRALIVGNGSVG